MGSLSTMQDREAFLQTLNAAVSCDMPKLLACCEFHIAAENQQRLQPVMLRLEELLPISSALRIAQGLRVALQRMGEEHAAAEDQSQSKGPANVMLCKYLPGPKEFLQMAQQQL